MGNCLTREQDVGSEAMSIEKNTSLQRVSAQPGSKPASQQGGGPRGPGQERDGDKAMVKKSWYASSTASNRRKSRTRDSDLFSAEEEMADEAEHNDDDPDGTGGSRQSKGRRKKDANARYMWSVKSHRDGVKGVAWSRDGSTIVSASEDWTVSVIDSESGKVKKKVAGHHDGVTCVAFSPDGHYFLTGSYDNTVRVWDCVTLKTVGRTMRGHRSWVRCGAFSPDGSRCVSGSEDKTLRIWNVTTKRKAGRRIKGHSRNILGVAWSPDGSMIASCGGDNTVLLWDPDGMIQTGTPLRGHTKSVSCVAFSRDSETLVSGSFDGSIILWSVADAIMMESTPMVTLKGHTSWIYSIDVRGDTIVSAGGDKVTRAPKTAIPSRAPAMPCCAKCGSCLRGCEEIPPGEMEASSQRPETKKCAVHRLPTFPRTRTVIQVLAGWADTSKLMRMAN